MVFTVGTSVASVATAWAGELRYTSVDGLVVQLTYASRPSFDASGYCNCLLQDGTFGYESNFEVHMVFLYLRDELSSMLWKFDVL